MNIEELREYCLGKQTVTEGFPFGQETLVFKVQNKIFLLTSLDNNPLQFNVKCDPEMAIRLRESYFCVRPGFHMNKTHWNTVRADGSVSDDLLKSWIDHSYNLIVESLPKKERAKFKAPLKGKRGT
jgi:predicted DNA-binding protein (MmcQ/YjbR family)